MNELEQTKSILESIRLNLKREKESVVAILKDPKVAEWQTIELERCLPLLAQIGIDPAAIRTTLVEYPKQAKKIGAQIAAWGNEVGNQLADLIAHPEPKTALPAARKLEEKSKGITAMKEELLAHSSRLVRADQLLRQQLALKPMLPIAKLLTTSRKDLFDGGLITLNLLIGDIDPKESAKTLAEIIQEPAKLETRFQRLDVTKLPRIIEEILFHHIDEAVQASQEIALFLGEVNDRLSRELKSVSMIEQNLQALRTENTAGLLNGIMEQATVLGNLVVSLYHKRSLKDSLATVNEALELLNIFHLLLKTKLIAGLQKEVEVSGSPLNPITISVQMTRTFFTGATGILRSLKLMMTSLTGKGAINEAELQLILEKGIVNCKHFFGKSHADLKKIKLYIDSLVGDYAKPFPYNDLFRLAKASLSAYGEEVEKFIANSDIPKEMHSLTTVKVPAKAGKLLAAIAKHNIAFAKANTDRGSDSRTSAASTGR